MATAAGGVNSSDRVSGKIWRSNTGAERRADPGTELGMEEVLVCTGCGGRMVVRNMLDSEQSPKSSKDMWTPLYKS